MTNWHGITKLTMCGLLVLFLLNAGPLRAELVYDPDGDCDVDGVDIYRLISDDVFSLEDDLPGFVLEFGSVESCCSPIGVGNPIDGYPNWQERAMIVFTNMVRMSPVEYRDFYLIGPEFPAAGILDPEIYPAVGPLYWNHELNQAARFHAEDMAQNCGLQHYSCDGTLWSTRIRRFYNYNVSLSENVAYGLSSPWQTVNLFLCEHYNKVCEPDGSSGDGHRTNIMRDRSKEIGTGHARVSHDFWVQDFGGRQPDSMPPVVSASHAFVEEGVTSFFLNYFDAGGISPAKVSVVINNSEYPLALDTGKAYAGTYRVDVAGATGCRAHFFLATTGNGDCYRYPATSHFHTYGEGSCLLDYD